MIRERAWMLRYAYIACLVLPTVFLGPLKLVAESEFKTSLVLCISYLPYVGNEKVALGKFGFLCGISESCKPMKRD